MEMNSFGEDLVVKARKPYTITKQRERWTEEEHGRFLEALKLYGRAWQRIEEHIGTKTAIQIRSHAQKFFTKLEKEAVATGIPLGRVHDIDIPPPRPKKKPNYPYPRKIGSCSAPSLIEAADEKTLKTVNPIPQEINKQEAQASVVAKSPHQTKEYCDEARCSVVLNLFQEAPSASIASRDKASKSQLSFREYVPTAMPLKEPPSLKRSSLTIEVNMESTSNGMTECDQDLRRTSGINMELHALSASSGNGETSGAQKQPKNQSDTNREAKAMHIKCVDGCNLKTTLENGYSSSSANPLMNHTIPAAPAFHSCSATSYISHPFPTFPSLSPAQLQTSHDFYRSFLGMSSTFSSEIVSALLRYSAGHAAACMSAASHWHSDEMDSSKVEAIAAATVAAASAWWTTNGLIPFFSPIHASGFAFSPPATSFPVMNTDQTPQEKMERHETYQNSSLDQTAVVSSPSLSSSSNLEENEKNFSNFNNFKPLSDTAYHDSDRAKINKHERSSCGSNTTSSSEIERFTSIKKNGETKDATIQAQTENLQDGEVNTRRGRSSSCSNETWKEVSQEGRLAFQALFTRDILPQSFATQLDKLESGLHEEEMGRTGRDQTTQNHSLPIEIKHGNLKVRRTGFKPYKRCSAEAGVNNYSAKDETNNKKIRMEG
ncbi:protein CCA1-like [Phalaenopsis equestris]|uniref:protein CCA1-like n=1 Tax=Phalaenopsis equestris TaxID=78828 RepID=UPI0009E5A0E1|nr:protein CCA1-like [Phalaenopsis equestris]XP_020581342.1 protein CCA1-like [Phalaenopsis equestris]